MSLSDADRDLFYRLLWHLLFYANRGKQGENRDTSQISDQKRVKVTGRTTATADGLRPAEPISGSPRIDRVRPWTRIHPVTTPAHNGLAECSAGAAEPRPVLRDRRHYLALAGRVRKPIDVCLAARILFAVRYGSAEDHELVASEDWLSIIDLLAARYGQMITRGELLEVISAELLTSE